MNNFWRSVFAASTIYLLLVAVLSLACALDYIIKDEVRARECDAVKRNLEWAVPIRIWGCWLSEKS